jgi:retron-type reverse transcriptase
MYKEKPWVMRQYENTDSRSEPTTKVKLTIDIELKHFGHRDQRMLQYALASFLDISPNAVQMHSIEEGSTKAVVELPTQSAEQLLNAYRQNDPELEKYLFPLTLLSILKQSDWFSVENLERAWKYAKIDIQDDFVFDIIDYADVKSNLSLVLSSLHTQIKNRQYYPTRLLRIGVPKSYHSVRPGTVIPIVDLIVLYAIAQQLVPLLDPLLSDSTYAYRLNPQAIQSGHHLFKTKDAPESTNMAKSQDGEEPENAEESETEVEFPYNWFVNWKLFHDSAKIASEEYEYAAVTDITAYFENISLDLLREILKEKLSSDQRELVDRLFRLLEFWDWAPTGNLPRGIGLPQGNDVSSFLSNVYLMDLDQAMLKIVKGDSSKYYRYVDDVRLFTSDQDEARRGLVELESVLRTSNLNVQSAKTRIVPANKIFDNNIEAWLNKMSDDEPDKVDQAIKFFEMDSWRVLDEDQDNYWQRPYSRCLTILREAGDDRAVETALKLFLSDPSNRLLTRNFIYLRNFVATRFYGQDIANRLLDNTFTFPYHRAYMYRLGAYSRDNIDKLKQLALHEATDIQSDIQSQWFCRMAALFCLTTFPLDSKELAQIAPIVETETNPQIVRAAFVTLCQYSGKELRFVLDRLSFFNAPHQDYLRRYFFRLYKITDTSKRFLSLVKGASVKAPTFIHNLHKLDLLKTGSDNERRAAFKEVIEMNMKNCEDEDWPRLQTRLEQIYRLFVVNPS